MAPKKNRGARKGTKFPAKRGLTKPQRSQVLDLVNGQAETKRVAFYETASTGAPPPLVATGLYSGRGWALQNNQITSNVTDIHQLIPFISKGIDDWNRIGSVVKPVSLTVKGAMRISGISARTTYGANSGPSNIHVYIYVLQHVSLKSYPNLRLNNDFTQLLQTGEGTTVAFDGEALSPVLPVSKQFYKVLARKKVTLKFGGFIGSAPGIGMAPNAHSWYGEYSMDLSKHLPAKLVYPESTATSVPTTDDAPTNSSIFMCMGYVNELNTTPTTPEAILEQTYVSSLLFKDS